MSGIDAGIRVGKYEVGRELGKGGFGIIYLARDHELGRDVAIKFLRPEHVFKPTVVQRFLQEARATARINHPGIVTVFETGIVGGTNTRADGTVYIAMELLAGDTLAQKLRSQGKLPVRLAINYGRQLASALGAAHGAGIVHRDLKPANVFLVPDLAVVGGERVKVLDFGIAKLADDFGSGVQTHSMVMLGTPMYMSPEQCKSSAKVDARSDIYSLGCILFEMLCGRPVFDGDSGELIAKHQLVPPPTPRSLIRELPEPLDELITTMLAKSADDRPQTMGLVEDALADLDSRATEDLSLAGDTSPDASAYAPTTEQPARAKTRRLPLIAGGLGAALLGVVVGLFSMCGNKKPTPQANVPHDAPRTLASSGTDGAAPIVDAAVTPPASTAADVELECQTLQVNRQWPEVIECASRLEAFDPKKAAVYRATAQLEATSEKELAAIEEAIEKKDKERAKKLLAKVDQRSVYRKDAEAVIATGKNLASHPAACNADMLKDKGMENVNMGQHATALAQFEASLRCKQDGYVESLAFMAACNAQNVPKAQEHYQHLSSAQRMKYVVMCERNHIPQSKLQAAEVVAPANCDADALKDKGMENVNQGQHAAALAQFEASLRCKNDTYVLSLAFMAACNAQNAAKAKFYYAKLSPVQQQQYRVMCVRNKIDLP